MKVHMVVLRLKGSIFFFWWKTLLPLLNLVIGDVSWELVEGQFQKMYVSKEVVEHQLNEIDALRRGSHTVPK